MTRTFVQKTQQLPGPVNAKSVYNNRMGITAAQYNLISEYLPRQRGNVKISNLQVLNAILYVAEQGCKWRGLPEKFGHWHTVYTRANRWAKNGVLDRLFSALQDCDFINVTVKTYSIDSTISKVHPDGTGALKKTVHNLSASAEVDGQPKYTWSLLMTEQQ